MQKIKETELYYPVKEFLEKQGYRVKSEIVDCDVVAVNDNGAMVIIELKTSASLKLILQTITRKDITDNVYVGIPENSIILKSNRKQFLKLLKLLGIGLLLINPDKNRVTALLDPSEYRPRKRSEKKSKLLKEYHDLVGDPNKGGSQKISGIMTVYRQKALEISEYLLQRGKTKASDIKNELNEPKTWSILYTNVYGWFEKCGKGVYELSPKGRREYKDWTIHHKSSHTIEDDHDGGI